MVENSTLLKSPPIDSTKSLVENVLELTDLSIIEPNLFTNTRPLWHPPGARGIFGGAVVAQSLAAALKTVPMNFDVHSIHCYFILPGDSRYPIIYHVVNIRDGRSFVTRTVQAKQHGKCIFTSTMSFTRESSNSELSLQHAISLPDDIQIPTERLDLDQSSSSKNPIITHHENISNLRNKRIHKKVRHWMKARGKISEAGGHQAHLIALAYISDSHFLGTAMAIHNFRDFPDEEMEEPGRTCKDDKSRQILSKLDKLNLKSDDTIHKNSSLPELGMSVSLDHTIYFHEPRSFRADEWILTDMTSPWSGHGRGVVMQHMFSSDGKLIATCHQEGVLRLSRATTTKGSKL